jgi:inhibitor of cysteine peptidase
MEQFIICERLIERTITERKIKMFKKITLSLSAIILILSMAGCNSGTTPTQSSNASNNKQLLPIVSGKDVTLSLDESANGTTQQLKVGELMAITLESNPSTGYSWFATSSSPEVIAQTGDSQYQEPQSSSGTPMMGAAGTETLSFQAISVGTATLTLDYKRGWETNVAPEKTITITVEVK